MHRVDKAREIGSTLERRLQMFSVIERWQLHERPNSARSCQYCTSFRECPRFPAWHRALTGHSSSLAKTSRSTSLSNRRLDVAIGTRSTNTFCIRGISPGSVMLASTASDRLKIFVFSLPRGSGWLQTVSLDISLPRSLLYLFHFGRCAAFQF
jgi:hypothetical protein